MAKHDLDQMEQHDHVRMLTIGRITFAARVHGATGVWHMVAGLWDYELRRAANYWCKSNNMEAAR